MKLLNEKRIKTYITKTIDNKVLQKIELVLFEKRNKLMPHFLSLVTIEIKQMEAVVFLFILDKFNSSLSSTPFQLLIIILSCNNQIVFLSYKDQHPLSPKPSKILYTRIHPRIKRREGAAGS
jgi:hypothetical protein